MKSMLKKVVFKLLTSGLSQPVDQQVDELTLKKALAAIDRLFDCDRLLNKLSNDDVIPYYSGSEWGYRYVHSGEDAI